MKKLKMHYDGNVKIDIAYASDEFTDDDNVDDDVTSSTAKTLEQYIKEGIVAALMDGTTEQDSCKVAMKKKKFTMKMEDMENAAEE